MIFVYHIKMFNLLLKTHAMRHFFNVLVLIFISGTAWGQGNSMNDHLDRVDIFFEKHVKDGFVDYRAIDQEQSGIRQLVKDLATIAPLESQKKAFWINAYNILVIYSVIQSYPTNSVMDDDNFFSKEEHTVSGKKLSLDQLEKELLFEYYPDARLHFVLVCGAVSCPPLYSGAFRPENLEQQLAERTAKAINSDAFIRIDNKNKRVGLSRIFEWYSADFGGKVNFLSYINRYRKVKIPSQYTTYYYDYIWMLNGR